MAENTNLNDNVRNLIAIISKEDKWFIAECPQIGTVSQGKSEEDALRNLKEATELYLDEVNARVVEFALA